MRAATSISSEKWKQPGAEDKNTKSLLTQRFLKRMNTVEKKM